MKGRSINGGKLIPDNLEYSLDVPKVVDEIEIHHVDRETEAQGIEEAKKSNLMKDTID